MSKARDRREASARLGLELRKRYNDLVAAQGEQELIRASVPLGVCFNENVEFMIWVLLEFGGVEQMPMKARERPQPITPALPQMPEILLR